MLLGCAFVFLPSVTFLTECHGNPLGLQRPVVIHCHPVSYIPLGMPLGHAFVFSTERNIPNGMSQQSVRIASLGSYSLPPNTLHSVRNVSVLVIFLTECHSNPLELDAFLTECNRVVHLFFYRALHS